MKAATSLASSLSNAVVSPTSRIPHLQWHIARNARARQARKSCTYLRQYSTSLSAKASISLDLSRSFPDDAEIDGSYTRTNATPVVQNDEVSDLDGTASNLLAEACPERMIFWLTSTTSGNHFTKTAEDADFARFFTAIDPAPIFDHFKQNQRFVRGIRPLVQDESIDFRRSMLRRIRSFMHSIRLILHKRCRGRDLTIPICQHALQCAASLGDARVAQEIWQLLMPVGHKPNLECYNAYMSSFTWNLAYSEQARTNYRMWSENVKQRNLKWRRKGLLGYDVNPENPESLETLKGKFLTIYKELSERRLNTNEDTFINLIFGLGKAADLSAAESVLRSVWNIDVASLQIYDEEELPSPTSYPEDDPLRPSSKLLGAIIHTYCINNQIDKGLFVLDYTSRNYALQIPASLWEDFFEWAHILSTWRGISRKKQGQDEGHIRPKKVEEYYNKITDLPYNVQPTNYMRLTLARSFRQRRMLDRTIETLQQVGSGLDQELDQLQSLIQEVEAMSESSLEQNDHDMPSARMLYLLRKFQAAFLSTIGTYGSLRREVNQVLTEKDWPGAGKETTWYRQRLPRVMEEFFDFCPLWFEYKTDTGHVKIDDKSRGLPNSNAVRMDKPKRILAEASIVWEALEPADLLQVQDRLKRLPEKLKAARVPYIGVEILGRDL